MTKPTLPLILGLSGALVGVLPAAQVESIAVSATAERGYVRPVDATGRPRPESYVFAKGQFFDGSTVDGGLARTTFTDITRMLAPSLAKQNYFPSKTVEMADLIIMVHWGTTLVCEDPQKDFTLAAAQTAAAEFRATQEANGLADPTALNFELGALATARESTHDAINRNAILLGYARNLGKERRALRPTSAEITMSNELNEERYFVILMAYDNKVRTKEHKSKLLWATRLSMRSPGNNFPEALPTLAQAGASVFGRHVDDLVRVQTPLLRSSIKLGEMEVIGPVEDKTPPPPPAK